MHNTDHEKKEEGKEMKEMEREREGEGERGRGRGTGETKGACFSCEAQGLIPPRICEAFLESRLIKRSVLQQLTAKDLQSPEPAAGQRLPSIVNVIMLLD